MSQVGLVESLWRYPVKSMRGEEIEEAFVGFSGVYGDRCYAFRDTAAPAGFPFLTARDQERMILYRPRFRNSELAKLPPNLAEAEKLGPGVTAAFSDFDGLAIDVETPDGRLISIDDPAFLTELCQGLDEKHGVSLVRSHRSMTDCRPISIFSLQTKRRIEDETGVSFDKRRFRANIYADLGVDGFLEEAWVGRKLQIGSKAVVAVIAPDPRCKMITLDPDTAEATPQPLRVVAQRHGGNAGIYGAVLAEGVVRNGDPILLLE